MRFTLSAAATLAAIGISSAAPATRNAPAPAPAAEPAPAPAPVQFSAPAPSYAASSSSESEASRAPLAPVSDDLFQFNPAREYSIAEILETPHRWSGREAAAIEVNPGDTGAVGIAVLDPLFVVFRKEQGGGFADPDAPWVNPTGAGADGRIAVGYMTPAWALAADVALFQVANDPPVADDASSASYEMDRLGVFGSMPYGDASLYGRVDWVTGDKGSWSAEEYSGRDWDYNFLLGYRTYVPGTEGIAYNAYLNYQLGYERMSGDEDPRYIHTIVLGGDYGTRRTRDDISFLWGTNSFIGMINSKVDPDWDFTVTTRPNMSLEIAAFKNWTLKGGVAMDISYHAADSVQGDDSDIDRYIWTFQPDASLGLRYSRGRWAAEALATGLISRGPWFMTGATSPLARFAITCDFGS